MSGSPDYFIGLQNTVTIRKGLLEAAKESVLVLKAQYRLRDIRAQKKAYIDQLATHVSEVTSLIDALDADLPEHDREHMPEAVRRAAQRIEERQHAHEAPPVAPKPKPVPKPKPKPQLRPVETVDSEAELRALEQKLSSIESKLNKL